MVRRGWWVVIVSIFVVIKVQFKNIFKIKKRGKPGEPAFRLTVLHHDGRGHIAEIGNGVPADVGSTELILLQHVQSAELQRSEEHTSELQSLMRISYAVFCLKKKNKQQIHN